ncbi:UbiA family prenyltransferase [Falsihalocynthiibacter sp. SS001]|uniref:UbiA family prenyltransferase n=1 Tax=Falsihalocynthiibacter sp. SS001 TaxID=3349698 RepID=UPI0036D3A48E
MGETKPLVLDVDGTYLKTDMLFECFWAGLGKKPITTLKASFKYFGDRARLKHELAEIAELRVDLLPVNQELNDFAQKAKAAGQDVYLASASDQSLVAQLSQEYDFADKVYASTVETNLKGEKKAAALVSDFGERGFDYAGNEAVDLDIWAKSDRAIVVDAPKEAEKLREQGRSVTEFSGGTRAKDLIKSLRPHQWVKNVLLFLPLFAAHDFSLSSWLSVALGVVAFSAAASSIYIINDLLDLEADRLHVKKRFRPFASGAVPIKYGMILNVFLTILSIGIAATLGTKFFGIVVLYMFISLVYSIKLKRMRWIDIAILATLYTLRVIAGAAASDVRVSVYMLVFIFPIFITLGCVKRLTELYPAVDNSRLPGRAYSREDRQALLRLGGVGIFGALLLFFLYSLTDHAASLYPSQGLLWFALLPIAAWLIRMLKLGYRGKQDHDPIVFALKDKHGLGILMFTLSLMFYAAGLWQQLFNF